MDRFWSFKWPVLLIQTSSFTCNRFWKDLRRLNTLEFAPTLTLKSNIFTQLTEVWIEMYQILSQIEIYLCKNNLLWAVWAMWNLDCKYYPIDLYRESGSYGRLWICSSNVYSKSVVISRFSKDLGLFLWHFKWIRPIGTLSIETAPHPLNSKVFVGSKSGKCIYWCP